MNHLNWKCILLVAKKEYIQWITSPKCILLFILLIPIREIIISPIIYAANQMNQPINIFEPCIALVNSGLILLLIPFAYLTLMADFPRIDGNMLFLIPRIGRRNWIAGEILFQLFSLLTYMLFVILSTVLQVCKLSYCTDAWSLVTTDYDSQYANEGSVGMSSLIPPNLYYQMTPSKAFALSFILLFFSLFLWGGILLWSSICARKTIAYWLILINIALGIASCSLGTWWEWFFPISHSILWIHYQEYYRKYVFSPWISLLLLGVCILLIYLMIIKKSKTINLDILSCNQ